MALESSEHDRRVAFLAATARDASATHEMLAPFGIRLEVCRSFADLLQFVTEDTGAILLPEEAVSAGHLSALQEKLAAQPPWSDLPILMLTRPGADSEETVEAVRVLGNVTLIERPVRRATLVSAVRSALRARERQHQIREYLAQRTRAEEALLLADRRKDEFLATLSHELRNPLAPLQSAVQILKTAGAVDSASVRARELMERQISHLVRLVNDLLEVSRITRGLTEVQPEPVDLSLVLRSAVETSRPAVDAAGHDLRVETPDEPVIVLGDTVRLTQVFANLLNNAAKYTPPGGHIRVHLARVAEQAVVSVQDDGIGIPGNQLGSVFEMFTQVDRSSRQAQGGLGIGLTLVRSLVGMHGGQVEARSAGLGAGSEFVVTLPVAAGEHSTTSDSPPPADFPARRVLIVDDNQDAADSLGDLLGVLGATVSVAYSGAAALDAFAQFEPDAVLLDIGMPEMDGYEVARRIRSAAPRRDVLLIALTGWGQEHDHSRSRHAGLDHHLVKPPDVNKLRELLARH